MPTYRYTARDERGSAVSGSLAAPSPEALADQLRRMGYLVTGAREIRAMGGGMGALSDGLRRVGADEIALFDVQLSKMVRVGIPLVTSLTTLAQQTEHAGLRRAVGDVAVRVEAGSSFSEALSCHPAVFSPLFISMVRAGEVSGKLDQILQRLADFARHQAELRQQLKTALTYPMLLLAVGIGVCTFLITGLIPKFVKVFLEAGVALPWPTRALYVAGQILRQYWGFLVAGSVLLVAGLMKLLRTPAGRRRVDTLALRVPVIGDIVRKAALSRLTRTLETLLSSGVPVLESLAIAEQTCGNTVIADVCRATQTSVRQGGTLSGPLRASREVPPMASQMVAVGEASGTLDTMLGEIAGHYDELLQHRIKRMTTFIEPLFLMVMGGMVAVIMASILLPLFQMVKVIR